VKTIGLYYPVKAKTQLRAEELKESGRVFETWLSNVGQLLNFRVWDFQVNGQPPEGEANKIDLVVEFGKVKRTSSYVPTMKSAEYDNYPDLVMDILDYFAQLDMEL
jgi:hypothetical protein